MSHTNIIYSYLVFLVAFTTYRVRSLIKSYQRPVGIRGKVFLSGTFCVLLIIYLPLVIISTLDFLLSRHKIFNVPVSALGVVLFLCADQVRKKAISALGNNMSPEIEIKHDHSLIKTGPYRYLRHPLSVCVFAEVCAFALISNSYNALAGAFVVFVPFLIIRAYLEERVMIKKFGDEYLAYKKEVYAFFPLRKRG